MTLVGANCESDSTNRCGLWIEHVNDMAYSVEKLNSLVSAARVDLESFKAREKEHKRSTSLNILHLFLCTQF